ncbi:MAG: hypothetical protein ACYCOR_19660 [Acidobacteriaceae bacterium]
MSRKRIIGFAVTVFVFVTVGALIYEVFDMHDTKPFLIDPEFLLMMLSSMLIFCVGIPALFRRLCNFCLFLCELLPLGIFGLLFHPTFHHETFEMERLLFSPPLSATSLRI